MKNYFKNKPKHFKNYKNLGIAIHADCLKENGIPCIKDKTISLILCDLPYGMTGLKWDTLLNLNDLWGEYKRVLKPNGIVILFATQPFATSLINSNQNWFKYELIWVKNNATNFGHAKNKPLRIHENILIFSPGAVNHINLSKNRSTYNPQNLKRINIQKSNNSKRKETTCTHGNSFNKNKYIQEYTNYPKSVLYFDKETISLNETQKPVLLCNYLIKTFSNENEIVLDNTAGSFTTAISCLRTKRRFICIEKRKSQYLIGIDRIEKTQKSELMKTWWLK